MKLKVLFTSLTSIALLAVSGAATATSITIDTPATSFLVTEAHAPTGVAATTFNGSVNYTPGLWALGGVSSAVLTLFLKDDVSSNLSPFIDAPREWAQLTSVTDGAKSLLGLPGSVEVDLQPFTAGQVIGGHTVTAQEAALAASVGAENLFNHIPTLGSYFNLDVSSLLNASNSGALNFSLGIDAKYPDIPPTNPDGTVNIAYAAIAALTGGVPAGQPIYMIEDYIFDHAQLTVTYVPEPSVILLIGSGLMGLIGFRKKFS